jgi:hypothetical protein
MKSSKRQHPEKFQARKHKSRVRFGCWNLELLWMLELGIWSFDSIRFAEMP